jgi:putative redox protein
MSLISITRKSGLEFAIKVRGHQLTSDMSEGDGGRDGGPSPSELLVGSLGACIAMMVQIYCDRHGYRNGDVSASMTYELADNPKRIGAITIDLEIPKDVPEDRKEAIRRVAEACVIHGSLNTPPVVDMEILIG